MKWILIKLLYDVNDDSKAHHIIENGIDIFLITAYLLLSIYNAFSGTNSFELYDLNGQFKPSSATIKTIIMILINFIVVTRMYVRLYVQWQCDLEHAIATLNDDIQYDKVTVAAYEKRLNLIKHIMVAIIILLLVLFFLGNDAVELVAAIAVIAAGMSWVNTIIDILISMYHANPKPAKINYFDWR